MYLTSRFPAQGFDEFWVSPPEFFEFREINQSFSAVGAFTTGEVNLMAGERPRRVRSASVTDDLLTALGVPAATGPAVRERGDRRGRAGRTATAGRPAAAAARAWPILSHELWQGAFGGQAMVGQMIEVNGVTREVIGILPRGADVMDSRAEIWLPIGLNPGNRQNRGSHFLYLVGRLKDGVSTEAARAELDSLVANWGERVGVAAARLHQRRPPAADGAGAGSGRRQRQPRHLGAAGGGRLRPAHRLREPRQPAARARRDATSRVRGAHGARRRSGPAAAAVHDRGRRAVGAGWRAGPGARARGRGRHRGGVSGQPAAHQRGGGGPARAALHAGHLAGDRHRVRASRRCCTRGSAASPPRSRKAARAGRPAPRVTTCAAGW